MLRLNAKITVLILMASVFIISAATPSMASSELYTIQISAHKSSSEADLRVADLSAQGIGAYVSEEKVTGRGVWYRVYVGRYVTNKEAVLEARRLKDRGIISDYWVKPVETAGEGNRSAVVPGSGIVASDLTPLDPHLAMMDLDMVDFTGGGSASAGTGKPEVVRFGRPREASLGGFTPYGTNQYTRGPFFIGFRIGAESWLNAGNFVVTRTRGALTEYWKLKSEKAGFMGVAPSYRINEYFTAEAILERTWAGSVQSWTTGLGMKAGIPVPGNFYPYVKLNGIWSTFVWEAVPGSFDSNVGYEMACGFDVHMNRLKLGFELGYRSIEFDYQAPTGQGTFGGDTEMDLSAVRFSASLGYAF